MDSIFLYAFLAGLGLVTSFITATIGMGGGILLLAALPNVLPANVLIPVHGAVQLSSNLSRFLFDMKDVCTKPLLHFFIGSLIGSYFGSLLFDEVDFELIPLIMSIFILTVVWLPVSNIINVIPGRYLSLGIIQTALALYVGATGPLSTSVLFKDGYNSNEVIVTNAAINTIINISKIIVFSVLGFVFHDYIIHIVVMSISAVLGSYLGAAIRLRIDVDLGKKILMTLISILCVKNIVTYFV